MKTKFYIFGYIFVSWILFNNCKSLSEIFNSGTVDIAIKSKTSKESILVGIFENRGRSGNPNITKNLIDFLKFHFLQKGYLILELKKNRILHSDSNNIDLTPKEKTFSSLTEPSNVLPINTQENMSVDKNYLQELQAKYNFDFYLCGSIGIYNSDHILEDKETTLALIKIYDSLGDLIGISSFSIQTNSGSNPFILNLTSSKISSVFHENISNGKAKVE